ncbi:hypothetical protein D3C72_1783680 [compost metagenome]
MMATTTCSQCNASYPSVLAQCPSCKTSESGKPTAPTDIRKYIPLIVALDLVIMGGFLFYFFVLR